MEKFDFSINLKNSKELLSLFINTGYFDSLLPFFSASSSQLFLRKHYTQLHIPNAEQKSYENCYPFIYYLEHAKTYYEQASIAPLSIQPTLTFYGFVQLLKACLLTVDPNYPESTSLLAHGVTTRKRKKQQYEFLKDEVKIQKNGLITCLAEKIFNIKQLEGEKFTMETLLKEIPEMQVNSPVHSSKQFETLTLTHQGFLLPSSILDHYQMTSSRFVEFLSSKIKLTLSLEENKKDLIITPKDALYYNGNSPIRYNTYSNNFMLSLNKQSPCYVLPELILHYLVLYNLSMIARYETEWWSELFKTMPNDDYPTIIQFLKITPSKTIFLVSKWLNEFNKKDQLLS